MNIIDRYYKECSEIIKYLEDKKELSFKITFEATFQKSLLLSSASYFEHEITSAITNFISKATNNDPRAVSFLRRKALNRQYHTFFSWTDQNVNTFLALFGDEFLEAGKTEFRKNPELKKSAQAFLQIGCARNLIVHSNYGSATIEMTPDEIYTKFKTASLFLDFIRNTLL